MKNNTTKFESGVYEVSPMPFHAWHGEKWEVASNDGQDLQYFAHLTDALMYVENVDTLDELSREARQYWNMVTA